MDFTANTALFGADPLPGIIAVEPAGDASLRLWRRASGGKLITETVPFAPYLWLREPIDTSAEIIPLAGDLPYRFLARCKGWKHFLNLRADLREREISHFMWGDPVQQYLSETGRTFFKGLAWEDLRRMQLDIEVNLGSDEFEFPSAERPLDHVTAIALADSTGWEHLIVIEPDDWEKNEKAALQELSRIIAERDPDVLEGHNIFRFDLPYLFARARLHKLKLAWGRDASPPANRPSRVQMAERTIAYVKAEIAGRHVIDTYLLAQFYDVGTRELEGFGLKDVARHFGVAAGGAGEGARTYLSGREIFDAYRNDRKAFAAYALDDVRETRALSGILARSYFTQAQLVPLAFQDIAVRGPAAKIDALFLREYLRRGHSIPNLPEARSFEGGYTDVFVTGVRENVWHCDVASLYPSVMLSFGLTPKQDALGIFPEMLRDLRTFRLAAKARQRETAGDPARARDNAEAGALQNTFKLIINAFYGYLGFSQAHFADFDAAAAVTAKGRELLTAMVEWLREAGAQVVEIDTDGIYFVPPRKTTEAKLAAGLRSVLPEGIEVEFDARYRSMFSYKAKNYALLKEDGGLVLKGGALKSRGLEPFQREWMESAIRLLVENRAREVHAQSAKLEDDIRQRRVPIETLAKTETLQDSLAAYQKKISGASRNRSAAYELAIRSGRAFQQGDQITYYITGAKKSVSAYQAAKPVAEWKPDARDENVEYYAAKVRELQKKFAEFLPPPPASAADEAQGSLL